MYKTRKTLLWGLLAASIILVAALLYFFAPWKKQKVIQPGETFTRSGPQISDGTLAFTVSNARAVCHAADIPGSAECFSYDAEVWFQEDEKVSVYRYPEFIDENGTFMEGSYLVLVDVSVENRDARNRSKSDGDPPYGDFEDPYLFRADGILWLTDKEREYDVAFFSQRGKYDEHPMAYRVEPGETVQFTLGFLVSSKPDGSLVDLSDVYAVTGGNTDSSIIDLHLEGGGK